MEHPLIGNLDELTIDELTTKISELSGKLNIAAHNILIQCESSAIPEKITIDIEKFGIGRTIFTTSLPENPAYSFPKKTFILSILGRGRKDKGEAEEQK